MKGKAFKFIPQDVLRGPGFHHPAVSRTWGVQGSLWLRTTREILHYWSPLYLNTAALLEPKLYWFFWAAAFGQRLMNSIELIHKVRHRNFFLLAETFNLCPPPQKKIKNKNTPHRPVLPHRGRKKIQTKPAKHILHLPNAFLALGNKDNYARIKLHVRNFIEFYSVSAKTTTIQPLAGEQWRWEMCR